MSHPDDELLAAVAIDEPVHQTILDHVDGCERCAAVVVDLRATLSLARAGDTDTTWSAPPSRVWDAIAAELDSPVRPAPVPSAIPEVVTLPRQAVAEARPTRRYALWLAGAAAAGLVVGVGGTLLVDREERAQGSPVASVPLDTLDTRKTLGEAQIVRTAGSVDLRIATQPLEADGGYLEVWLINSDLKRMVSVGVLGNGQRLATFPISPDLISQGYVIVDISREGFDDKPQHSGDSVVRGKLPI